MKIITDEEKQAHIAHITSEGAKGLFYGAIVSTGLYTLFKKKMPQRFNSWNTSIKACAITIPTIGIAAFWADQGSWEFDKEMHHSGYNDARVLEEYRQWNKLSTSDKFFTLLNDNKYKIIISAWVASLYGSWVFVNRDKIMSTTQKAVQARMYAQGFTIVLLLSTVLLAIKEEEINKKKPAPIPEWKRIIMEKQAEDEQILKDLKEREAAAAANKAAVAAPASD